MRRSARITVLAVLFALSIVFNFVPISFGPVNIALLLLPIIICAQLEDFKMTIITATFTGLMSCIAFWSIKAGTPLAPVFQNPLISVFPRIMVGVVAYFVSKGLTALDLKLSLKKNSGEKLAVKATKENLISACSSALATLTNTLLVLLFIFLIYNGKTLKNGMAVSNEVIAGLITVNFAIEVIAFTILIPPITFALSRVITHNNKTTRVIKSQDKTSSSTDSNVDGVEENIE